MAKYRVIKNRKAYLRRRRIRRFLTLAMIVMIFAYVAHRTYANQKNRLEVARAELAVYQERYDEVVLRQGYYENQVIRLQDEDYIAMLAREQHFMSLPNEIVFRIGNRSTLSLEIIDQSLSETERNLSETER